MGGWKLHTATYSEAAINIQYLAFRLASLLLSVPSAKLVLLSNESRLDIVNVIYLTKLTRANGDQTVIKCSLTQYVLMAIVALNIIHAGVVLPIMADMYYTGSFFSNSMWGVCVCRIYVSLLLNRI